MKLTWVILLSFQLFFTTETNYKVAVNSYIDDYRDIAISEMHRTGIPASIKLAQGILESNCGRSELATVANNHFGIKCGKKWTGKKYYRKDDDRNHKGELIKSCFRSFDSASSSYKAHSDFLTDEKKQYRYGFLFELDPTDYKAWAKGLKKSGYATDKSYANKLISIIEKYNLSQYDTQTRKPYVSNNTKIKTSVSKPKCTPSKKKTRTRKKSTRTSTLAYEIVDNNGVRAIVTNGGESIKNISIKMGISSNDILVFNELYSHKEDEVASGVFIYLEKKKRKSYTEEKTHVVQEGETMATIAQLYGIRLRSLYAKNRMPKNSIINVGETLQLKERVQPQDVPSYKKVTKDDEEDILFANDSSVH